MARKGIGKILLGVFLIMLAIWIVFTISSQRNEIVRLRQENETLKVRVVDLKRRLSLE